MRRLDILSRHFCPTLITLVSVVLNFITGMTVKWSLFELGEDVSDLKCIIFYVIAGT